MKPVDSLADLEFFEDEERLPKVPKVLRVSKKEIFALAAKEFRLTVLSETTTEIDEDMYITELSIGNMLARESYDRETKNLLGRAAPTKKLSIENAYQTVLEYLETEGRIKIDDYNSKNVSELKKNMLSSNTWSMLFEDKAKKLANDMNAKNTALCHFLSSFDSMCEETSALLSLLPSKQTPSSRKRPRRETILTAGKTDLASLCCSLPEKLLELRAHLLSIIGDSSQQKSVLLHEPGKVNDN